MQISEKYARYIGRHSLKFGGVIIRSVGTRNNPQIPDMTYSSLADLLANKPARCGKPGIRDIQRTHV